jgi:hypothetical protein
MTVPLYSYDFSFRGVVPERTALKLEREGVAKIVRMRKGRIARVVMRKRPSDPDPPTLDDYMGQGYSFKHYLHDGHRPWALKPLAHPFSRADQSIEYHLAPECVRPIFLRVLLDCLASAPSAAGRVS